MVSGGTFSRQALCLHNSLYAADGGFGVKHRIAKQKKEGLEKPMRVFGNSTILRTCRMIGFLGLPKFSLRSGTNRHSFRQECA